jgi:hypothetical protein
MSGSWEGSIGIGVWAMSLASGSDGAPGVEESQEDMQFSVRVW